MDYTKLYEQTIHSQFDFIQSYSPTNDDDLFMNKQTLLDTMISMMNISTTHISPNRSLYVYYDFLQRMFYYLHDEYNNTVPQPLDLNQYLHDLFLKKNKTYGNAFACYSWIGVFIRLTDKIHRFLHLDVLQKDDPNEYLENLIDTYVDALNYILLCQLLLPISNKNEIKN